MSAIVGEPDGATPLDPDEMEGLKFQHVTTRGELDQLEQANIQEGLKWLKKRKNLELFTEAFVCDLHKRLFGMVWRWAGTFRKTGKNIGVDAQQISVELRKLLDDAKYQTENETYSALELATRFHHRLVKIHPFPNGNGRHSRIMTDAILTKALQEKAIDWAGGHNLQTMGEHRRKYIAALRSADHGDYEPLLKFTGAKTR
ncbi:MAG: mobile mystery protein B [Cellvibrionaceae bacterium]